MPSAPRGDTKAVPTSERFASGEVIAEIARERQLAQLQQIDGLDTKAATLIGFVGVILGLIFTSDLAQRHWNHCFRPGLRF